MKNDKAYVSSVIVFVAFLIVIYPFLLIWAWNTLFGAALAIEYSLSSWAAVLVLAGVFGSRAVSRAK
jgi:hypothetical protein